MKFTKMQGCGNDYVYVNGFTEKLSPEEKPEIVRSLSDRHFGIGSDGLILIKPSLTAAVRRCAATASAAWQNMSTTRD